ncbi:uncharacterized protein [Asterias amurensis]|uniref:uncharacterized protein n=1 Tax=Asterias amurensis TaxID=7602 RepID=UPI003AB48C64
MDGKIYVLLVCVWCPLDAGGLLVVVTAQPIVSPTPTPKVSAEILTPEADRKVGGQVDMRCTATGLESKHIVELWSTRLNVTLRWNNYTFTSNNRFMFTTTYPSSGMVVQDFAITDLQIDDYGEFICNVRFRLKDGGSTIVATESVTLSAPSYPICSPSGPITIENGTERQLRCLYETDNRAAIAAHPMTDPSSYPWTSSSVDGKNTLSLNLTVTAADDGVAFNCSVLQGSGADGSGTCIIGPISVTISTDHSVTAVTIMATDNPQSASSSAVIAGAIGGGVAAIIIIIIIIFICRKILCHQTTKDPVLKPSTKFTPDLPEHSTSFVDPYGVDTNDQSHANHPHPVTPSLASKPAPSPTKPPSSEPAVYAQPNSSARGRYSENPDDVTSHNNPAFNSTGLGGGTELYAPIKPIAKVRPSKTPRKPEPYKPKSERQSNPPEPTNRDPMPRSPPTDHDHDESYPVPDNPTNAQVSRPKSNPDHIVYADLDLLSSDEAQDDEARRPQSSDAVMYASVQV